jgi:hypothetical protein
MADGFQGLANTDGLLKDTYAVNKKKIVKATEQISVPKGFGKSASKSKTASDK